MKRLAPCLVALILIGCDGATPESKPPAPTSAVSSKQETVVAEKPKLTADEAKRLASETMDYFSSRKAQFAEDAVMNDDALRATFLYSKELKGIADRWPAILDGDTQAKKFGHCRHLMLTAQSYAESMNQLAFKGGSERTAKENRKDFLKDWKGCESALAG